MLSNIFWSYYWYFIIIMGKYPPFTIGIKTYLGGTAVVQKCHGKHDISPRDWLHKGGWI